MRRCCLRGRPSTLTPTAGLFHGVTIGNGTSERLSVSMDARDHGGSALENLMRLIRHGKEGTRTFVCASARRSTSGNSSYAVGPTDRRQSYNADLVVPWIPLERALANAVEINGQRERYLKRQDTTIRF